LEQTQGAEKVSLSCSKFLFQNRSMIYGYARASTEAQDLTGQLAQLKAAGCEKVFREKLTGTNADRPQLQKLIDDLAGGDVVIIPAVARRDRPVDHRPRDAARRRWQPFPRRAVPRYHV
jgi:Resolvase, N terminal domain